MGTSSARALLLAGLLSPALALAQDPGAVTEPAQADGGPTAEELSGGLGPAPAQGEEEPLAQEQSQELQELRERVQAQEQQLGQLRAQLSEQAAQSQQLEQLVGDLQGLRDQVAEAQSSLQAAREERAARLETLHQSTAVLGQAEGALAYGQGGVDDLLSQAEGSLNGQARSYVSAARAALADGDLYNARVYIQAAASAAAAAQLNGADSAANP